MTPLNLLNTQQKEAVFQLILQSQYYQRGELDHALIRDKQQFEADWRDTFERYQRDDDVELFIAVENDIPIGYICVRLLKNGAFIDDLFVNPDHRKQGIAREMINEVKKWARAKKANQVHLTVARTNPAAIALYKHIGFKQEPSEYLDFSYRLS